LFKQVGPHKTSQCAVTRGFFGPWKQPVYYEYDQAMTPERLSSIISNLSESEFTVVATVCDMGTSNQGLWTALNVGIEPGKECYFPHPADPSLKIFVFADVPHLLKLIRNHFLDTGFIWNNARITTECLEFVIQNSISDLKIAPKLLEKMLKVAGSERQKVKPAAHLFSRTVANSIIFLGERGLFPKHIDWKETAEFIQLVNDWFDVMNSSWKFGKHPGVQAYGLNLEHQNCILDKMTECMTQMQMLPKNSPSQIQKISEESKKPSLQSRKPRKPKKPALRPFQKGIILSYQSLKELFCYLRLKYNQQNSSPNIDYILTRRLNSDIIEQLFAVLRAMGFTHDNPSALEFKYRIRNYILGKNAASIISANTEDISVSSSEGNTTIDEILTQDMGYFETMEEESSADREVMQLYHRL
jgi:hypothetical protein